MRQPSRSLLASSLLFLAACGGASVGCPGLQPLPAGYQGPRQDDPMSVRLSADGLAALNQAWPQLLALVSPGQSLSFPVTCTKQTVGIGPLSAGIAIGDQGAAGCTDPSCGAMDGQCTAADVPITVPVTFTGLQLGTGTNAQGQGTLRATLTLQLSTGKIYAATKGNFLLCGAPIHCGIDFDGARAAPADNTLVVSLELFADPEFSGRLNVRMTDLDGLKVCGTSGALPAPACTDGADLELTSEPGGCCPTSNATLFKDLLLQALSGMLEDKLREQVDTVACATCNRDADCPVEEDGRTSTCDTSAGTCTNAIAGRCPPAVSGIEGRLDLAALVGSGPPAPADLSLVLGHGTTVDTGVTVGSRGGSVAAVQADCVPVLPAPQVPALPPVSFEGAAPAGGFHLGISLTRSWMDQLGHSLHQSGGLCLQVGSRDVPQLTTGALRAIMPSLGLLAGPGDAPALVVLRPQTAPTFRLGAGTFSASGDMLDPLITLTLEELAVDVYGLVEDRQVRLFTATLDLVLPLSLQADGCGKVLPVLGALEQAVQNPRFSNAEMLAEDPQALAALLPALISAAQPGLASALTAITLPPLGDLSISLAEAKGLTPSTTVAGSFERLGLFTKLVPTSSCPATTPASVTLEHLQRGDVHAGPAGWPSARIALGDAPAGTRWAWRLDGGPWSPWLVPAGNALHLRHPGLLLQGHHRVELKSLPAGGEPAAIASLSLVADLEPPRIQLERAGATVVTRAADSVAAADALRFQYALGQGAWSSPGPARGFALDEVERAGGLSVRAEDPAGWAAEARYRVSKVDVREEHPHTAMAGCSAVPPRLFLPAALLALFALRRRR